LPEINSPLLTKTDQIPKSHPVGEHAGYLPHVDGLRALAVMLVVLFHAWPGVLPGGFIGVDVFFVISGFIITRQIASEMEHGTFSYAAFLGRRIRRLLPAAFVCTLLVTAAATVILMPDTLRTYGESLTAVWLMLANVFFYLKSGYFDAPSAEQPLLHMWSLAVEDQFYLTWPLLLALLFAWLPGRPRIAAAALLLAALSLAHSEYMTTRDPSFAFYLPLSRAFELLAGCALGLVAPLLRAPKRALPLIDTLGLALVLGSAFALNAGTPFPGLAVVPTVAGSAMLIGAGLYGATPVSRLLSLKPMLLTGKMSYSIYLYHWPSLALATYWLGRAPDAAQAAVLVAGSVALAALSWMLIEQWATRRLARGDLPPSSLMTGALLAALPFIAFAVAASAGRGWPERLDGAAYAVYRAASEGNPRRQKCDGTDLVFRNDAACAFGRPHADGSSFEIAVFGDSNADHFVPMIAKLAEQAGLSGRQVTQSTCGPLIGASGRRASHIEQQCARFHEAMVAFLDRNPKLKIAVLGSVWSSYWNPAKNSAATLDGEPTFARFAEQTIGLLRTRGIQVLVIGQVPTHPTFSLPCFVEAARDGTEDSACTFARTALGARYEGTHAALKAIAAADPGVRYLDMADLLCTASACSVFKDGLMVYRDRGHLNASGSSYLARYAKLPPLDP